MAEIDTESKWEIIFRTGEQVEAELIRGLLTTSGIPVVVEPRGMKSMTTFFGHAATGELLLKVPPDQAELARQLLSAKVEHSPVDE